VFGGAVELSLRDFANGEVINTLTCAGQIVYAAAYSDDGSLLAVASGMLTRDERESPGVLEVWDAKQRRILRSVRSHVGGIRTVAFQPKGHLLATGGFDNLVRVWSDTDRPLLELRGHEGVVRAVAFSPNGKFLASASEDGRIIFWDVSTGNKLAAFEKHFGAVTSLAFLPDGRLVSGSMDTTVRIWDVNSKIK
jgi:WD40 repeat protein